VNTSSASGEADSLGVLVACVGGPRKVATALGTDATHDE